MVLLNVAFRYVKHKISFLRELLNSTKGLNISPAFKQHVMTFSVKRSAVLLLSIAVIFLFLIMLSIRQMTSNCGVQNARQCITMDIKKSDGPLDFAGFNNETGTPNGCYIIPNIIHFIRFTEEPVSYIHMICYLAALKNQQPDKIIFHYNDVKTFSGKYWAILQETPGFMEIVEFHYVDMPKEIFGQEMNEEWRKFHGSDVTRIRVLMKHGGIFLDNDSYLIRSLNDFRRYEFSIGWDDGGQFIGTQIIVAHKDARFLKEWLETYRDHYKNELWYYNAGERPTVEVLYKTPELVHRVKYLFGVHNGFIYNIFAQYWPQWRFMYTLHLLHRHMYMLGDSSHLPTVFDEKNVLKYGNTFREMALDVYNPDKLKFQYEGRNDEEMER